VCKIKNTKIKVLILHGWQGSPSPHWQTILEENLNKNENYEVLFPELPSKDNPLLEEWLEALDTYIKDFKPEIIICHSLANILWFHYINSGKMNYNLKKLMMVSPVSLRCNITELNSFFPYALPSDLKSDLKIMASSDNDEFMHIDELYELSNKLSIGLKILEGAGHLNVASGYGELSCAYDWVIS